MSMEKKIKNTDGDIKTINVGGIVVLSIFLIFSFLLIIVGLFEMLAEMKDALETLEKD